MSTQDRWLLPEGIEEALPAEAEQLESFRRRLVDLYHTWGYELVMPPLIEYIESLLTGIGQELDLQTFKLIDQLTGRLMGVRSDMTPQVARIDAHMLKREVPVRLCYLGTVLRTMPEGNAGTRSPLQVGAELYGHAGQASDIEIVGLMLETLRVLGIGDVHLDLGHVGIYRAIAATAGLDEPRERELMRLLQRKAVPEIDFFVEKLGVSGPLRDLLISLPRFNGGMDVLQMCREHMAAAGMPGCDELDYLERVGGAVQANAPQVEVRFDLAELPGYHYHTGVVFAAFVQGRGQEIARGGRYDDIGRAFGRARPATGFSADLKSLLNLVPGETPATGIFVGGGLDDPALRRKIDELRAAGERVIVELAGQQGDARAMGCDRRLMKGEKEWFVVDV